MVVSSGCGGYACALSGGVASKLTRWLELTSPTSNCNLVEFSYLHRLACIDKEHAASVMFYTTCASSHSGRAALAMPSGHQLAHQDAAQALPLGS